VRMIVPVMNLGFIHLFLTAGYCGLEVAVEILFEI